MAKIKPITTHKKYRALVAMYRYNWVAACLYLFGAKATLHQNTTPGGSAKERGQGDGELRPWYR